MKKKIFSTQPLSREKTSANSKVSSIIRPKDGTLNYKNNFKVVPENNVNGDTQENVKAYENLISKMFKYLEDKVTPDIYEELKNLINEELKTKPEGSTRSTNVQEVLNLLTKNSRNAKNETSNLDEAECPDEVKDLNQQSLTLINNLNFNLKKGEKNATVNSNSAAQKNLKLSFDFTNSNKNCLNTKVTGGQFNNKDRTEKTGNITNKITTQTPKAVSSLTKEIGSSNNTTQNNLVNLNYKNASSHVPNLNLKGYLNFSHLHFNNQNIVKKNNNTTDSSQYNSQINNNIGTQSNPNLNTNLNSNNNNTNTNSLVNNNNTQSKSSLFTIIKNGNTNNRNEVGLNNNLAQNSILKPAVSKTQSNSISISKSNSRETNPRSIVNSLSQSKSKSKSKLGLKTEIVNLNNSKDTKKVISNPAQNVFLKLNAKLSKKTGISPEGVRAVNNNLNIQNNFSLQNNNNLNNNNNNTKVTSKNSNSNFNSNQMGHTINTKLKNKINLSSQSNLESGSVLGNNLNIKKNPSYQKDAGNAGTILNKNSKKSTKPTENLISNYKEKSNQNYTGPSNILMGPSHKRNIIHSFNPIDKKNLNSHTLPLQPTTNRDTYVSNNTNNSINLNEKKKIVSNATKKIMDLTYNVGKESERDRDRNTNTKYIDLNDNGIINSEATIISNQANLNLIEVTGENKNQKNQNEIIKEIKLNLDDNLKNMFNFSYENFHKEQSESGGMSTKKSGDLSDNEITIHNDYDEHEEHYKKYENGFDNEKNKKSNKNNEYSVDHNDNLET